MAKLSQKEGIQPSKTFSLQVHSKEVLENSDTPNAFTNNIWAYMYLGHDFVTLGNLKIDVACISS